MKIAIISDSHDAVENVNKIINKLNNEIKPDLVIHLGDFCAPATFKEFFRLKSKLYCVFGNVDGDIFKICEFAKDNKNVKLFGNLGYIELDGKKIAFVHDPDFASALAFTEKYDLVCHGHTHIAKIESIKNILLLCPGSVYGNKEEPKFAVYDTKKEEAEIINI